MASRKLVRDLILLSTRPTYSRLLSSPKVWASSTRLRLLSQNGYLGNRQFSVFNEFSKNLKEASKNEDIQKSVKELKEKAEVLKEKKEEFKVRTKRTTEQLYKKVDGAWTEAEATAKKVSANLKEKISATKEEVKDSFGIGKQDSSASNAYSAESTSSKAEDSTHTETASEPKATSEEEKQKQSGTTDAAQTFFHKFRSSIPSVSPKVSAAFQKVKAASPINLAKKGYDIVKDELSGNPGKRKLIEYEAASPTSSPKVERSARTDVTIVPIKQSKFSKKWESLKEKMKGHPIFKRVSGLSEPVVVKSQELAEDIRDRWETTDNPVVHKIQDLSDNVLGETSTALSTKEIRRRDPSFSLPDFVSAVQEVIKPVLKAYFKGDAEVLKKYCTKEVIERCKAEHKAYQSQGIFFENKILHISDVDVRETKMMGDAPLIIVGFQTQQVHCVRDRQGEVTEGSTDTIHNVYYAWAMQQVGVEELGEGALFPVWRLREMQQLGVQALI